MKYLLYIIFHQRMQNYWKKVLKVIYKTRSFNIIYCIIYFYKIMIYYWLKNIYCINKGIELNMKLYNLFT